MKFHNRTIVLFGVAIAISGRYYEAEPATRDYPGDPATVEIDTYEIGGVDVSNLIDTADWYEQAEQEAHKLFEP